MSAAFLLTASLALVGSATAGEADKGVEEAPRGRVISLDEAIETALRSNPAYGSAMADEELARARIVEARGADDPRVELGAGGSAAWGARDPSLDGTGRTLGLSLRGAVMQPLKTGGELGLAVSHENLRRGGAFAEEDAQDADDVTSRVAFQATHPLLRGAGPRAARAEQRRARAGAEITAQVRRVQAAELVRQVVSAYVDLSVSARELQIYLASAALAREQLSAVRAAIDAGKLPPSASAEVEVALALREESVLAARESVGSLSDELARLMGTKSGKGSELVLAVGLDQLADPPQDKGAHSVVEGSPQLAAAQAARSAADIEVDAAKSALLPRLDLELSVGPLGRGNTPGEAYGRLARFEGLEAQASLTLELPIGCHEGEGKLVAARAARRKAELEVADVEARLETSANSALRRADMARERAAILERTTELARADLAAEKARFEAGRATSFDVLRRQEDLAFAELRLARVEASRIEALAALEAISGTALARFASTTAK